MFTIILTDETIVFQNKMQADSAAAKETVVLNEPDVVENGTSADVTKYETHGTPNEAAGQGHTEHVDTTSHGSKHGGHSAPKQDQSGHHGNHGNAKQQPTVMVESNDMEVFRHSLVNNYRPVQPLNGRTVYRSFPFFDTPIPSRSRSHMDAVPVKEPAGSSATIQFSILTLAFGLVSVLL